MHTSKTKLAIVLQARGYSRTVLARLLNVSVQYVSALCTGQKKLTTATAKQIEIATQGEIEEWEIKEWRDACEACGQPLETATSLADYDEGLKILGVRR